MESRNHSFETYLFRATSKGIKTLTALRAHILGAGDLAQKWTVTSLSWAADYPTLLKAVLF